MNKKQQFIHDIKYPTKRLGFYYSPMSTTVTMYDFDQDPPDALWCASGPVGADSFLGTIWDYTQEGYSVHITKLDEEL